MQRLSEQAQRAIGAYSHLVFEKALRMDLRTDGRTYGRTDLRTDGRTYGRTDGPTDGRTPPLIEMLGASKKKNKTRREM